MSWEKIEKKLNFLDRLAGDKVVWIIVLCLFMVSLLSIFSSTSQLATIDNTRLDILKTHLFTVVGGIFFILLCYNINRLSVFKFFSRWGFVISLAMLVLLDSHKSFGPFESKSINDAWRIILVRIGSKSIQIHVLEIVKVAMVMYLAWAIDTYRNGTYRLFEKLGSNEKLEFLKKDVWRRIFAIYIPTLIICVIALPAGNSNALFIAGVMFMTILIGGMPFKDVFLCGLLALSLLAGCIGLHFATGGKVFSRVGTLVSGSRFKTDYEESMRTSKKGTIEYQKALDRIRQPYGAKLAIKRGGLIGKGPGNSTQKYVVPVIYEDYIYSFLIEEYGLLIGGIFIMMLYISLLARGSIIARNCDDLFGKVAIAGLCILISGQAMMHILVNCDVGLRTGQTLPLISYGTSAFLCFSIAFGIILSISRMAKKKIDKEIADAEPLISIKTDEIGSRLDELDFYEMQDNS